MFAHIFKYKLLSTIRNREFLGWTLLFPIVLASFFYLGFGNLMNGNNNKFNPIDITIVTEKTNSEFKTIVNSLSQNCDKDTTQLFQIHDSANENEAIDMLKKDTITAILYETDTPYAKFSATGTNQSIVETFLNQYLSQTAIIKDVMSSHPEKIQDTLNALSSDINYNTEISLSISNYDSFAQYFYALIAMTCLYATMAGTSAVNSLQANQSELGKRRESSPQHKLVVLVSEFLALVTVEFTAVAILILYINYVLNINLGSRLPLVFITGLVGDIIGCAAGMFIAALIKANEKVQTSIATGYSMVCSFLSGLMVGSMKDIIEHSCPIINRLNPAALIADSLYSLNMYDSLTRFTNNMIIMLIMAVLFCLASYLLLRRNKYASL